MNYKETNIYNLQSFHKDVLLLNNKLQEGKGFFMPKDNDYSWPQFLFLLGDHVSDIRHGLKEVLNDITWPVNAILPFDERNIELINVLREIGFMPLKRWPMMHMELNASYSIASSIPMHVDHNEFAELINSIHFKGKPIVNRFYASLSQMNRCCQYGVLNNNTLTAGCVTYEVDSNMGIYMMATKEEFRGKGWGESLIKSVFSDAINKNIRTLTLQATEQSMGFYEKMGFSCSGYYLILVKNYN